MKQHTLNGTYCFEGRGLHTGHFAHMCVKPAPENSGIVFKRVDFGEDALVEALAENVSGTARSTTLSKGEASVGTVEHLLSALTGLGVDNALIEIDNAEVPILDGSAKPYVEAILRDSLKEQAAERHYISLRETIEVTNPKSGSVIRIEPCGDTLYDATLDFRSQVMGLQHVVFNSSDDYASQIAPCRTFVFFHELEQLIDAGLIKGGDADNAIVIVEHPVSEEQLAKMCAIFRQNGLHVRENGYLDNLDLHFENECGRHKMLDLIGDLRLCGGFLKGKITAFKPGHTINTNAAKAIRETLKTI